tara:strand:+ start:2188 stop:2895 length:708 start_codon:yes stop_codon:yes gene_type:complete
MADELSPSASPVKGPEKAKSLLTSQAWAQPNAWKQADEVTGSPSEKKWKKVKPGKGIFYNGSDGKAGDLISTVEHGDVELNIEFMIPNASNSGIYFMKRYELQILDSFGKPDGDLSYGDCGGIYQRWDDSKQDKKNKGYEGTPPSTNASGAPGTWQKFRVQFRAPRFDESGNKIENARFVRVVHNGVTIIEDAEVTGPTRGGASGQEIQRAPLAIQGDHGPIAIRRLTVRKTNFE